MINSFISWDPVGARSPDKSAIMTHVMHVILSIIAFMISYFCLVIWQAFRNCGYMIMMMAMCPDFTFITPHEIFLNKKQNTSHVAHKRLANSILPQDLVDSTLFCLVYLPHFVWFREVNQTKPNSNLIQPKKFLSICKNEISWPPLNPPGPNINLLKWHFPPQISSTYF